MRTLAFALLIVLLAGPLCAAEEESNTEQLAKQLQNPVASLISIPFQNNFESGLGAGGSGSRYTLKVQPVVPMALNSDWNLITRPIVPYVNQQNVYGATSQAGLSDTQLEIFITPSQFEQGALMWGAGPDILLPTAGEAALGTEKWGIGPSACCLKQAGPWTTGALFTHLWSVAGNSARSDISLSYLQPFISHANKVGTAFSFSSETSYDWLGRQWTVPLIFGVSQIIPLAGHYFSFGLAGVYHLQSPGNISPWAARFSVTLLLPKKK